MLGNAIKLRSRSILFLTGCDAFTLKPFIYIKKSVWDNCTEMQKTILLNHEGVHMKQQSNRGLIIFLICYIISPSFRSQKEIEAYCASEYKYMTYQLGESKEYAINKLVDILYGKAYLLPYSKETIKTKIENYLNA